jgi:hypothetical protein
LLEECWGSEEDLDELEEKINIDDCELFDDETDVALLLAIAVLLELLLPPPCDEFQILLLLEES